MNIYIYFFQVYIYIYSKFPWGCIAVSILGPWKKHSHLSRKPPPQSHDSFCRTNCQLTGPGELEQPGFLSWKIGIEVPRYWVILGQTLGGLSLPFRNKWVRPGGLSGEKEKKWNKCGHHRSCGQQKWIEGGQEPAGESTSLLGSWELSSRCKWWVSVAFLCSSSLSTSPSLLHEITSYSLFWGTVIGPALSWPE